MARKQKTKAEVIASIDDSMETAITAGIVDHSTQISSWMPEHVAETVLEAELGAEIAVEIAAETETSEELPPMTLEEETLLNELEVEAEAERSEDTPAEDNAPQSLEQIMASFDDEKVTDMVFSIAQEIDARDEFERQKKGDGANIERTLKKVRSQLVTKRAARVLLATNVDPAFINREIHSGSKYNVYALGKLADVIYGVSDGVIANAINLACMRSLFRFRAAGESFNGDMARAAASDKVRVEPKLRKLLVSHTVSASTAPTQASSTMQALATLGVVKVEGSTRNPTYLPTDSPLCQRLEEKLTAAA